MRALGIGDAIPHQLTAIDDDMFVGIYYSAFRSAAMVSGLHDPTLVLDRVRAWLETCDTHVGNYAQVVLQTCRNA